MRGLSQPRFDRARNSPVEILWNAGDVFVDDGGVIAKLKVHPACITHERFCCNRLPVRVRTQTGGFAAATSLRRF